MKRHELDLTSLVSGAVFLAVGLVFLVDLTTDYSVQPRWVAALALIGVGVAGLLSTVATWRGQDEKIVVAGPEVAHFGLDAEPATEPPTSDGH